MLEQTFIHIPGIGPKTEQKLWDQGIHTWRKFIDCRDVIISPARDEFIGQELDASLMHKKDASFFSERLPPGEMWRTFDAFKNNTVYLDIETTGYYQDADEITVIGIYDGINIQTFVNGINLNDFEIAIARYDMVITFNGATFDLPFIRSWFPGISLPTAHVDLRFLLKKLGYAGGLKRIEKELGINRGTDIDGIDGFEAVRLWNEYQRGNKKALKTLIEYNNADIMNLKPLMELGYRRMKKKLLNRV